MSVQSKDFNYSLRFSGVDQLTGPLKEIRKSIGTTSGELRTLRGHERDFGKFKALRQNSQKTRQALSLARKQTAELGREIANTSNPTRKMTTDFKKARAEIKALKDQQTKEIGELGRLGNSLRKAGYNTKNLKQGQRELKNAVGQTSQKLEKHRRELNRVSDAYKKQKSARDTYQKSMQSAANLSIVGAAGVAVGTRTIRGTFDLVQTIRPLEQAIGQLQSLGIENLQVYRDQAAKTDAQLAYTTADSFIRAAYDIRSGMSGLTDEGVSAITHLSLVTARATKGEAEQLTSLTATAYGIFRNQYKDLSDIEWGEQFTSGLAASVRAYKTNGSEMQRAIESARGGAALLGMDMREEMAILGTLQTSMKGAEAGTALKSYAANAAKAHKAFGDIGVDIKILNSDGMLRETAAVMDDIRAHYGTLDAIEMAEIKKAFGTDEAANLINGLIDNSATFNSGFSEITKGMREGRKYLDNAAALMDANADAEIQQAFEDWQTMKRDLGYALLPVLQAIIPHLKSITGGIGKFAKEHKTLVGILGFVVVAFGIIAAVMGAVTIAMASMLGPLAMLRLHKVLLGGKVSMLSRVLKPLGFVFKSLARVAIPLLITGVRALGVALMTTPIGWIIGGLALVGTAVYLLFKHWGKVKGFFGKTWGFIKKTFAWSPLGILVKVHVKAFKALRSIIFSPVTAARKAWAGLKSIFTWSPERTFKSGILPTLKLLGLALLGPLGAARLAWDGLKKVFEWLPDGKLKSSLASFKNGFKSTFDSVVMIASSSLDWIEKKIERIIGAPGRLWGKVKGFGKGLRGDKSGGAAAIRSSRPAFRAIAGAGAMKASGAAIGASLAVMSPGPAFAAGAAQTKSVHLSKKYDIHLAATPGMSEAALVEMMRVELDRRDQADARDASNSLSDLDG